MIKGGMKAGQRADEGRAKGRRIDEGGEVSRQQGLGLACQARTPGPGGADAPAPVPFRGGRPCPGPFRGGCLLSRLLPVLPSSQTRSCPTVQPSFLCGSLPPRLPHEPSLLLLFNVFKDGGRCACFSPAPPSRIARPGRVRRPVGGRAPERVHRRLRHAPPVHHRIQRILRIRRRHRGARRDVDRREILSPGRE